MQLPEFDINDPSSCARALRELLANIDHALSSSKEPHPNIQCHIDPSVLEALFHASIAHGLDTEVGEYLRGVIGSSLAHGGHVWYDQNTVAGSICGELLIQRDVAFVPLYADYLHLYDLSDDEWFYGKVHEILDRFDLCNETVMLLLHFCCGLATENTPERLSLLCSDFDLVEWLEDHESRDDFFNTIADHWFNNTDLEAVDGYLQETIDDAIEDGEVELNGLRVCQALIESIYVQHMDELEDVLADFTATYIARLRDVLYSADEQESIVGADFEPPSPQTEWRKVDPRRVTGLVGGREALLLCELACQGLRGSRATAMVLQLRQNVDGKLKERDISLLAEDDERLAKDATTFSVQAPYDAIEYRCSIEYSGSTNDKAYFMLQIVDEVEA